MIASGCVPSALVCVGANCHKNHHESLRWLRWYQPQQSFWLLTAVAGSNQFVTLPSFKLSHKSLKTLGWQFFFLDLLPARQSKKCLDYNPCEEGGVCVYDSTLEKSTCKCRKGLHGTLCEKGQHLCFATFILPWTKKRTIIEIRGEKNAVPRVISCSISAGQVRSATVRDFCPALIAPDRA